MQKQTDTKLETANEVAEACTGNPVGHSGSHLLRRHVSLVKSETTGDAVLIAESETEQAQQASLSRSRRGSESWHAGRDMSGTWEIPHPPRGEETSSEVRKAKVKSQSEGAREVRPVDTTQRRESRSHEGVYLQKQPHGEATGWPVQPIKETPTRTKSGTKTAPPSLWAIAKKAKQEPEYRFGNLSRELTKDLLKQSWKQLNKRSATGVDKVGFHDYQKDLENNLDDLVSRLKADRYRARLVRRQYIPKDNGKQRALGIPVTEDKLLQHAVGQILQSIFEADFLPCSHGYRPNRGAHTATDDLSEKLVRGKFHWVVEADIRGFFDNIDHDKLVEMLEKRINDRRFIRLIRKWLKAGVLEPDGTVVDPHTGTPQGGVISPILANIYMHHSLCEWFEQTVKSHCKGEAAICVYADDFVCAFQNLDEAKRFYRVLPKRLAKYGLGLAEEKTHLLKFSRFSPEESETFDFLGFEFRWTRSRKNQKPVMRKLTAKSRFTKSCRAMTDWCKENRNLRLDKLMERLNSKLRGHFTYFGVEGNSAKVWKLRRVTAKVLFKWLNRRSQKRSYNWKGFNELLKDFPLAKPQLRQPVQTLTQTCF